MTQVKQWVSVALVIVVSVPIFSQAQIGQPGLQAVFEGTYDEAVERYPEAIRLPLSVLTAAAERRQRGTCPPEVAHARTVTNQCSLLGQTVNVQIPGEGYPGDLDSVVVVPFTIGAEDCHGRCGTGCPGDGGFFHCTGNNGYYRYTTDCIVHDACCDYWDVDGGNCIDVPRCNAVADNALDDCGKNGIDCCEAYEYNSYNFTEQPVAHFCERCPCHDGQGYCSSSGECGDYLSECSGSGICVCTCEEQAECCGYCGDGMLQSWWEACDDGNNDYGDGCLGNCLYATCGDGDLYIGVEECDDGGLQPGDGCDENCWLEWPISTTTSTTSTTNTTLPAGCGDGTVEGDESCDDGDTAFVAGDYCAKDCTAVPCGQPVNRNKPYPFTSDALFSLKVAVGSKACDLRVCDVDNSGAVVTTDALITLKMAVGQAVELRCPGTEVWDQSVCENTYGGVWREDGMGQGGYACFFRDTAYETYPNYWQGDSCADSCTKTHPNLRCVETDWNEDASCTLCREFYHPTGTPPTCSATAESDAPKWNYSHFGGGSCYYRAGASQDCNLRPTGGVAQRRRVCVCEPVFALAQ